MCIQGQIYVLATEIPGLPAQIHLITELAQKEPLIKSADSLPAEVHEVLSLKINELRQKNETLEGKNLALEAELKAQRDWNRQLEEKLMQFLTLALASKTSPGP